MREDAGAPDAIAVAAASSAADAEVGADTSRSGKPTLPLLNSKVDLSPGLPVRSTAPPKLLPVLLGKGNRESRECFRLRVVV